MDAYKDCRSALAKADLMFNDIEAGYRYKIWYFLARAAIHALLAIADSFPPTR